MLLNAATERIVVAHDIALNPPDEITIEGWIRLTSTSGCHTLVGKNYRTGYYLGTCDSRMQSMVAGASTTRFSTVDLFPGEWAHIAMTYDGTERVHYFNGVEILREFLSVAMPANSQALGIGGEGESPTFPSEVYSLNGRISEVRLWSYARSQAQIQRSMIEQITEELPGLIAVWPLENGSQDRFGRFQSTLEKGAAYSALGSPAVPFDPFRIRRVFSKPVVDGDCSASEYDSSISVPAWYESSDLPAFDYNPLPIHLGADNDFFYICFPKRIQVDSREFDIRLDRDNDRTFRPDADDLRFTLQADNSLQSHEGTEAAFGSWVTIPDVPGVKATRLVASEFYDHAEFKIPRSLLPSPNAVFGLSVEHVYRVSTFARHSGWPADYGDASPRAWQPVTIDLSDPPRADSRNPSLYLYSFRDSVFPGGSFSVTVNGTDDVDMELIEIFVDGVLVESCDYPGMSDTSAWCNHNGSYANGLHTVTVRGLDHTGRFAERAPRQFRVQVDGDAPSLIIRADPAQPAIGEPFTITATASDASGIDRIRINEVLGLHFPSHLDCSFPAGAETQSCDWTITAMPSTRHLRFRALAWDQDGYMADTTDLYVLIGNTGTDTDRDGIADRVEVTMCTDPENPDTDYDSISDLWEAIGVHFADGSLLPLHDYGVNPCARDTLLQLDYEALAPVSEATVAMIKQEMRAHGIHAYIETHERPNTTAFEQSHLAAQEAAYQTEDGAYYFDPKRLWAFKYGYQRALPGSGGASGPFFTTDAYRGSTGFCFGGSRNGESCKGDFECGGGDCAAGCSGGSRRSQSCGARTDCPGDDGIYFSCDAPCTTNPEGGENSCSLSPAFYLNYLVFHEFGHTLGLGHGGRSGSRLPTVTGGYVNRLNVQDHDNYKPHHLSIMNYRYSFGIECMNPPPVIIPEDYRLETTALSTFAAVALGNLNENELDESSDSLLATRLQSMDCSHAGPEAEPIFKYQCQVDDTGVVVISNGRRALASRREGQPWDFTPDNPGTEGIDWNCNGVIDSNRVASDADGRGGLRSDLAGTGEWEFIPNAASCHVVYAGSCGEPSKSCYVGPEAYRAGIPTLANGQPPLDCRRRFLDTRTGDCALLPESDFPTTTCPLKDRDSVLAKSLTLAGIPPLSETEEQRPPDPATDIELCDLVDNDGDGQVDEYCADSDGDGAVDLLDNCRTVANADQADRDGNGLGDACQHPEVLAVSASFDGSAVTVDWTADSTPRRGFAVYRIGQTLTDPVLLGRRYPTTEQTTLQDFVTAPDNYTYLVRPVNLDGREGEAMAAQALVDTADFVFGDSFEQ
ncbi:MAG: hypothetical protein QNJ40_22755 [Xanthomonadales bacterium]|nr:hypothetical protein [Xanthomonadales bacterium]